MCICRRKGSRIFGPVSFRIEKDKPFQILNQLAEKERRKAIYPGTTPEWEKVTVMVGEMPVDKYVRTEAERNEMTGEGIFCCKSRIKCGWKYQRDD